MSYWEEHDHCLEFHAKPRLICSRLAAVENIFIWEEPEALSHSAALFLYVNMRMVAYKSFTLSYNNLSMEHKYDFYRSVHVSHVVLVISLNACKSFREIICEGEISQNSSVFREMEKKMHYL